MAMALRSPPKGWKFSFFSEPEEKTELSEYNGRIYSDMVAPASAPGKTQVQVTSPGHRGLRSTEQGAPVSLPVQSDYDCPTVCGCDCPTVCILTVPFSCLTGPTIWHLTGVGVASYLGVTTV